MSPRRSMNWRDLSCAVFGIAFFAAMIAFAIVHGDTTVAVIFGLGPVLYLIWMWRAERANASEG